MNLAPARPPAAGVGRVPMRPPAENRRTGGWIRLLVPSLVLLLTGAALGSGTTALFFCALGAGGIGISALWWSHDLEPHLLGIKFLILSYTSQPVFVAGLSVLGYFEGAGVGLPVAPEESPIEVALALIIVPLAGAVATWLYHLVVPAGKLKSSDPKHWLQHPPPNLSWFLILGALVSVSVWMFQFVASGPVAYLLRVFHKALFFVPILAGAYWLHFKWTRLIWIVVLAMNLGLGFVTGARTWGFYPLALYGLGAIMASPPRMRRKLFVLAIPAGAGMLVFLGLTGVVRDQLGRGGGEVVTAQRINDAMIEASAAMAGSDLRRSMEAPVFKAMSRVVRWTNVAVPIMTPTSVSYRGIGGLAGEVRSTFSLGQFSSDRFYANDLANDYGFRVDEGTSVEFGILPDGWSRGGAVVAFVYGLFAAAFLILLELFVRRAFGAGSALMQLVLTYVIYIGFVGFISYSLLSQMRLAILCIGFLGVVFWPVERLTLLLTRRQ